ncbi:MAG: twin-arginine translocation signal domain-containing protein [Bacteroidetes bacterium]|nr:twin-arginine translocation signal domain-containing protein [Bacteroidota bacterium]
MNKNFSRRDFLKTGSVGLAGVALAPSFLNLLTSCTNGTATLSDYMNHFEVSEEIVQKVIETALSRGGDYCDLFFEHTISNNIALQDNAVNRAGSNIDFGVGVRVLKGDQTGYAYSEDVNLEAMQKVAKTAASIANTSKVAEFSELQSVDIPNFYKVNTPWEQISIDSKIPFLKKLNDKIFSMDEKVVKVGVSFSESTSFIMFVNSEGKLVQDYRPMVSLRASCIMEEGDRKESFSVSRSLRKGFEFLTDELVDELANEAIERTNILFDAVIPMAGEMPVVLGAGSSGILLHEAIGHAFEADFNRKKESIFSDKMGKEVAKPFVNIIDDGSLAFSRGSINIDDEGNPSQKTYMVKDGILNSYLHDRLSAQYYKVDSTGNGRRQSFRHSPVPRMRNTYMEAGPHTNEEIIASVKNGVYVDSFTNGQVKIGAGDFTFYVKAGYLIENGKLTTPIKDINLIGNGPAALADITMVSNEFKMDYGTWTCGKAGQGVPVGMGMPSVKVAKLTVGGKNA